MKRLILIVCCLYGTLSGKAQQQELSLQEAVAFALENSIVLQQGELNLEQRQSEVMYNYGQYLPTLNASGSHTYNWGRTVDPLSYTFVTEQIRTNYFTLSSQLVLFEGLQKYYSLKQAKANYAAGEWQLAELEQEIQLTVINLYLQVMLAMERVNRLETQILTTEQQLEQVEARIQAGAETPVRRLELQAQLAQNRALLVDAQNSIQIGKLNLKRYINMELDAPIELVAVDVPDSLPALQEPVLQEVWQANLERLPEIQRAEANLRAANYAYKTALGGMSPRLSISGNLNTGYSSQGRELIGSLPGVDTVGRVLSTQEAVVAERFIPQFESTPFGRQLENNFGQSLGLSLSIPILNNLAVRRNIQVSRIQQEIAELNLLDESQDVKDRVFQAYINATTSYSNYLAARANYQAQERLLDLAQVQFEAGLINYYEYNVLQNQFLSAQADFLQSKYEYVFQSKIFDFYLGNPLTFE